MAVGVDRPESQRGAVEHFIGTLVRQTATACPSHQSRRSSRSRPLPSRPLRRLGVPEKHRAGSALGPTESRGQTAEGHDPHAVRGGRHVGTVHADVSCSPGSTRSPSIRRKGSHRARVPALFRNALDPGQYPYPFWHDAKKWADYQAANEVTFWVDPVKVKVVIMQFSARGKPDPRLISAPRTPARHSTASGCGRIAMARASLARLSSWACMTPQQPLPGPAREARSRILAGELRKGSCHERLTPPTTIPR